MTWYRHHVVPILTHLAMRNKLLAAERERWVPLANGTVLEIGVGSGLNIPFYGPNVRMLYALEPLEGRRRMAATHAKHASFPVQFLAAGAEMIPLADASLDSVVTTQTRFAMDGVVIATASRCGRRCHNALLTDGSVSVRPSYPGTMMRSKPSAKA